MKKMFARIKGMMAIVPKYDNVLDYEVSEYFAKGHCDLVRLREALGFKDQLALYNALKDGRVRLQFLKMGMNHDESIIDFYRLNFISDSKSPKIQSGSGGYVDERTLNKLRKRKG